MNLKILEQGVGVGNQANRNTGFMRYTDQANRKVEVTVGMATEWITNFYSEIL
jgi:hypothetical protein